MAANKKGVVAQRAKAAAAAEAAQKVKPVKVDKPRSQTRTKKL